MDVFDGRSLDGGERMHRRLIGRAPISSGKIHRCEARCARSGRGPNMRARPDADAPHAKTDDRSGTYADTGNDPLLP